MVWLIINACSWVGEKIRKAVKGKGNDEDEKEIKGIHERECVLASKGEKKPPLPTENYSNGQGPQYAPPSYSAAVQPPPGKG